MSLRDLFRAAPPTGREPVNDRNPASREGLAELGQRLAAAQPVQQTIPRSRLFGAHRNDDMAVGGSFSR